MFHKIPGIENFHGKEGEEEEGGREYQDFPANDFCLNAEKIRREPFSVSLIWVFRKFLCLRGLCHDFVSKVFLSRFTEKLSRGTLLCFTKFPVSKTLWKRGGEGGREGVSIFSVEFFLSPVSKNFVGGSFIASFFLGIEKCQV